jgi:hypothetical protein
MMSLYGQPRGAWVRGAQREDERGIKQALDELFSPHLLTLAQSILSLLTLTSSFHRNIMYQTPTQFCQGYWSRFGTDYNFKHSFTWPSPAGQASMTEAAAAAGAVGAAGASQTLHMVAGGIPPHGPHGPVTYNFSGRGGWPGYRRRGGSRLIWVSHIPPRLHRIRLLQANLVLRVRSITTDASSPSVSQQQPGITAAKNTTGKWRKRSRMANLSPLPTMHGVAITLGVDVGTDLFLLQLHLLQSMNTASDSPEHHGRATNGDTPNNPSPPSRLRLLPHSSWRL